MGQVTCCRHAEKKEINPFGKELSDLITSAKVRMKVLPFSVLKVFGSIPRSSQGQTVLYSAVPRNRIFLVFVSHRWLQPTGSTRWPKGDPDDDSRSKYRLLVAALKKSASLLRDGMTEDNIYVWMDFACVDQDRIIDSELGTVPEDILALDFYIQQSDAILTPVVDDDTSWANDRNLSGQDKNIFEAYGAEAWTVYWSRAWCRLEAFCASALPQRDMASAFSSEALSGKRPHLLYGTAEYNSVSQGKIWTLPALSGEYFDMYNPVNGLCTNPSDATLIGHYVEKLRPLILKIESRTYEGAVDERGVPHGEGRMVSPDYTIYVGEFEHGKRHGRGHVLYANGVSFIGAFRDGKRHGHGEEWWANGRLKHSGMYEGSKRKGPGRLYSEHGELVYEGEFPESQDMLKRPAPEKEPVDHRRTAVRRVRGSMADDGPEEQGAADRAFFHRMQSALNEDDCAPPSSAPTQSSSQEAFKRALSADTAEMMKSRYADFRRPTVHRTFKFEESDEVQTLA